MSITSAMTSSSRDAVSRCTPFILPSRGVLYLDGSSKIITLSKDVTFRPECTATAGSNHKVPFYASTIPQTYAVAATTILSYTLVIVLLITRGALFSGPDTRATLAQARAIITELLGLSSVVGVGRRPWLQKLAALTVAVSLTMATTGTFKVARKQYHAGAMDARELRERVMGSLKIRTIRVISDVFLWLAQAQTLIRLFPRHREKIIIKWTAFALIVLYLVFSILNNFVYPDTSRPRGYIHPIPALSYLFQLALSLLYAAWVIYYSFSKRRVAFFHRKMPNICLVAILGLISVLVPVIFFVLDISKPDLAAWGDYVRWVGAAAASVVVWEWVERIEALEREERRHGILGREIFDDDEMLEAPPPARIGWSRGRRRASDDDGAGATGQSVLGVSKPKKKRALTSVLFSRGRFRAASEGKDPSSKQRADGVDSHTYHTGSALPRSINVSPSTSAQDPRESTPQNSRADTLSPATTCYAVRQFAVSEPPSCGPPENVGYEVGDWNSNVVEPRVHRPTNVLSGPFSRNGIGEIGSSPISAQGEALDDQRAQLHIPGFAASQSLVQPGTSPSVEHEPPRDLADGLSPKPAPATNSVRSWKGRLKSYTAAKSAELRGRFYNSTQQSTLPVIVVPAPPRASKQSSPKPGPRGQETGNGAPLSGDEDGSPSQTRPLEPE